MPDLTSGSWPRSCVFFRIAFESSAARRAKLRGSLAARYVHSVDQHRLNRSGVNAKAVVFSPNEVKLNGISIPWDKIERLRSVSAETYPGESHRAAG
jgi:hypothetical protein